MARKGNPISVRLEKNRSSDSSRFSDYYYGKSVYQDVNMRSYFGSIRPPTRLTLGFRLGRCLILHFPKRTFIHLFLPRRPRRLKRREKSRPGKKKKKGRWWAFGKVGPVGCLHSSDDTEKERNEVRGRETGKRVESIGLDDREKQNEIRIWPKKKQRYGYHDRSPSIKILLSKSLRVSGAFKHPKYAGVVNDIAFLIKNDDSFRKTKFLKLFFQKKFRSDSPTSHLLKRTLSAVRPSLNLSVMQYYLLNTKNKMHFDPVVVLNHFLASGVAEPSTMGGANAQGRSLDKRIRSRIAFFVESSTGEKKSLAEAKKRLTRLIRLANDLRFAGTTKTTISLFPFFGATFFFPRDGVGVYKNLFFEDAREPLLGKLRKKCWNLMGKDKVMELIEKFIGLGGIGELIKGIEMMLEMRNRVISYRSIQLCFIHLSFALAGLRGTTLFQVPWGRGSLPISSYWLLKMGCLILLGLVIGRSWVFMNTGDLMDIVRPFLRLDGGMNPGSGGGGPSDSVIPPFLQQEETHDKDAGSSDWETFGSIQEFPTLEGGQRQPAEGDVVDLELDSFKTKELPAWERGTAKHEILDCREALLAEFESMRKKKGGAPRTKCIYAINDLLKGKSPEVWYAKVQELRTQKKGSPFYQEVNKWFKNQKTN